MNDSQPPSPPPTSQPVTETPPRSPQGDSKPPQSTPGESRRAVDAKLATIGGVLNAAARWRILRELAKGIPLPMKELCARVGQGSDSVSKHMALMRKAGVVERVYSTCYALTAAVRAAPDGLSLDLGPCVLKFPLGG